MKESALRWTGTTLSFTEFYDAAFLSGRTLMTPLTLFSDQISSLICYARDTLGVEPAHLVAELELPENYEDLCFT